MDSKIFLATGKFSNDLMTDLLIPKTHKILTKYVFLPNGSSFCDDFVGLITIIISLHYSQNCQDNCSTATNNRKKTILWVVAKLVFNELPVNEPAAAEPGGWPVTVNEWDYAKKAGRALWGKVTWITRAIFTTPHTERTASCKGQIDMSDKFVWFFALDKF